MDASKCVTGATGFIAGHVTAQLVAAGHSVRGTVRDTASVDADALRSLPHSTERLELIEADLLEPRPFYRAVAGCETVFHVAAPFVFATSDPAVDLVAPAVDGTLDVLRACAAARTVRRVVFTSSIGAVVGIPDGTVIDEDDWNTYSRVDNNLYY